MRTTLTIEDDVAADLRRLQEQRKLKLKEAVNQVLRAGLRSLEEQERVRRRRYRIRPFDLGGSLVTVDDVGEALAVAEGEDYG